MTKGSKNTDDTQWFKKRKEEEHGRKEQLSQRPDVKDSEKKESTVKLQLTPEECGTKLPGRNVSSYGRRLLTVRSLSSLRSERRIHTANL